MSLTGDTFDFQQGNVVTSSVQIVDNGASVGDVLTVQADKSIAAAPSGGSQTFNVATVHVTSAQLKTLLATPITLVAAPGLGKVILPVAWFARYVFVTTDYSNWNGTDGAPWLTLGGLSQVDLAAFGSAGVNAAMFASGTQPPDPATNPNAVFEAGIVDTAAQLVNFGSQELAGGDSTLTVVTYYATLTLS